MEILSAAGLKILCKTPFEDPEKHVKYDLAMLKTDDQLSLWDRRIKKVEIPLNYVLELGIMHGGSIPYLYDICDAKFIVGVEIEPEHSRLSCLQQSSMAGHYALYHNTDQTDSEALNNIVDKHFQSGLDLIVDDASHYLYETRRSFEILFPKLRAGGLYVIEDHRWGHEVAFQQIAPEYWRQKPTMLQIIFEIAMYFATNPGAIQFIEMDNNTITITRGEDPIIEPFLLADSTCNWAGYDLKALKAYT